MRRIVTDEQRRTRLKSPRPFGVALAIPLGVSRRLRGADGPALRAAPTQRACEGNHGVSN